LFFTELLKVIQGLLRPVGNKVGNHWFSKFHHKIGKNCSFSSGALYCSEIAVNPRLFMN